MQNTTSAVHRRDTPECTRVMWHVLDVRATWVREFTRALAKDVPLVGWMPRISWLGFLNEREVEILSPEGFRERSFPLQRGFTRPPICWLCNEGRRIARRLERAAGDRRQTPLILTAPQFCSLAANWPGPLVYYATDMFRFYGEDRGYRDSPLRVERIEQTISASVDLVCPNSRRIAGYFRMELGIPPEKIVVIPNATREENLLAAPAQSALTLPADLADLKRPIAGVIGNLAANTDWQLLRDAIDQTPWLTWLFVGPIDVPIAESTQCMARSDLLRCQKRVRFVGPKPYGTLRDYARALDVAILPYLRREPTYSGSSTRFYEHLAACRPMLATRGVEELLHKEPLLRLVDTADEMVAELERLRGAAFRDGYEEVRWRASRSETWESRAAAMVAALQDQRSDLRGPGVAAIANDHSDDHSRLR